jgi:fatty-acyl-CoA synthase
MSETQPLQAAAIDVIDALNRGEGLHDRGFTFVGALGPGQDLYLSFHALREEIQKRAHHLKALGLVKGDRLAMVVPDGDQFVPTFLAAMWAGIVPVPLYPPLSLGKLDAFMEALVSILTVAKPKALVAGSQVEQLLWGAMGKVPTLEKLILDKDLGKPLADGVARLADAPEQVAPEELAFLQFTSGSTSLPKGVMVTRQSLAANCKAIMVDGLHADPKIDKGVSWLPLYHDMGLIGFVLAPITASVSVAYIPTLSFVKNATLWMETISKHKGTISFAPNFAYALVTKRAKKEQIARWDLSGLRVLGCGAEPVNPLTIRAFNEAFAPSGLKPTAILPAYGMAEATLAMSFIALDEELTCDSIDAGAYHGDRTAKPANADTKESLDVVSCGRTFPGHELKVVGDEGETLPERAVGEICFKGPSVAAGYFNDPEQTKKAGMGKDSDGWLRTGDLGYLANGQCYVSGRIKDILIINGRNYYPQRIEWCVEEVPRVRKGSAVVFSRPGKSSEEVVVAIESRERGQENIDALVAAIKARVNEELQLVVADVKLVEPGALPKTSSGKLQRRKTREQYLTGKLGKEGVRTLGGMGSRLLVAKHLAKSLVGRAQHTARGLMRRVLPSEDRSGEK